MERTTFALKGDIVYSRSLKELSTTPNGYLVCEAGVSAGVFASLPDKYEGIEVLDHSGRLIIPGLADLHTHAPQFSFGGLGMDLELLDWLETYTFPEEARYGDLAYAAAAYRLFVDELAQGATTRAAVFATVHVPATLALMDMLEASGLATAVGKVNMDRNASADLCEVSAESSLAATRTWIQEVAARGYRHTEALLTPRFIPSCSDELMAGLAVIQQETGLGVQSHLSENPREVAWVRELRPGSVSYAGAYLDSRLLGACGSATAAPATATAATAGAPGVAGAPATAATAPATAATVATATASARPACPTIMAHCVYSDAAEIALLGQQGVWVAHCPESNTSLASGIAPVRAFLDAGLKLGLGTDVAGGYSPSMFHAIAEAIKVSKLRWRLVDEGLKPLTVPEAFYLATVGSGSFWGRVGSFKAGYEFDAVILDDARAFPTVRALGLEDRLARAVYLDANATVVEKYVAGQRCLGY
jgi:guanine deaminase